MKTNSKSYNRRKGILDSEIHTNYFYVKDEIRSSDNYLKYCNGEIDKEEFYIFIDTLLNNFIKENKDFYDMFEMIEMQTDVSIPKYEQYNVCEILFEFCTDNKTKEICLSGNPAKRLYIHNVCDLLMLDHNSVDTKNGRSVHVEKTEHTNLKCTGEIKKAKSNKTYVCCECNEELTKFDSFVSVYVNGIHCEDCMETLYEGMKYEPLR